MHQIGINIVEPEAFQRPRQRLADARVVRAPELRGDEDLGARHVTAGDGGRDGGADFVFVAVAVGGVDVAVAVREGVSDGFGDSAGWGLPGACFGGDGY
jgi:hypothetical protein